MHFKKIKLMLKNSFKNVSKSRTQLVGVTVLVFLLSVVLTLVVSMNVRVVEKYETILKESRVHDALIDLNPYDNVATGESPESSEAPKNLIEAQQHWVYKLQEKYFDENPDYEFDWSRTEAREFSQLKHNSNNLTLKAVTKTSPNSNTNGAVDKLVIFEGHDIESRHQVVIDKNFAKVNGIVLGDVIRVQTDNLGSSLLVRESDDAKVQADIKAIEQTFDQIDDEQGIYNNLYSNYQWFQVVGFGGSADFVTPLFNESSVLPNRQTEMLLYVSPETFGLKLNPSSGFYQYDMNANGNLNVSGNVELESFYSIKFLNPSKITSKGLAQFELDFRELIKKSITKKIVYSKKDSDYRFYNRLNFIQQTILGYTIAASVIFLSILAVVLYAIALITKKQIENAAGQLGTLKALGYQKRTLVVNFVMLPLLTSLIGGLLGYLCAIGISNILTDQFSMYFSLNYSTFDFEWISLGIMIGFIWAILTFIAFILAASLMRKSSLSLIAKLNDKKPAKYKQLMQKIQFRKSFGSRLRKALLVDAFGKMMGIGVVVLAASQLFTLSFAAPNILVENKKASFEGIKYKQIVEYAEPSYNNPMSFSKTFKNQDTPQKLTYSKNAQGWTSLPLRSNGYFDKDQIMSDFYNGNINGNYYSIFIDSYFNSAQGENVIPTILEFTLANMKMLNLEGVIFDTNYFKEIAKYGIPAIKPNDLIGGLIAPMILDQWFDYTNLLSYIDTAANEQNPRTIFENGAAMQTFYRKYAKSIGLSVTNDFKTKGVSDQDWIEMSQGEKINLFNAEESNYQDNLTLKKEYLTNNRKMIEKLLKEQAPEINDLSDASFKYTNLDSKLGAFKIADEHNADPTQLNDYYETLNFDAMDEQNPEDLQVATEAIIEYWKWFTFMFYNRIDQSVIQTSYSRPPYFVKQNIASAYYEENKNYSMAFNLVQYDKDNEALGTKINASKNGFDFKIYGIQNDERFLELTSKNDQDLIKKLYSSEEDNSIVINETLAKKLNLSVGESVDFDVIQNELQDVDSYDGETKPFELDGWNVNGLWNGTNGFKQNSRTEKFGNIVVQRPLTGAKNSINFLSSIKSPTNYYQTVLEGQTILGQKSSTNKFKVVGVHKGYGIGQAWMKNSEANEVLNYDQTQAYLWKNIFARHWNNEFGYGQDPTTAKKDILLEDEANQQMLVIKKIKNFNLMKDGNDDLNLFKAKYINSPNVDADTKQFAEMILKIFENQYPVFNYKYSNSTDVGDYGKVLSISSPYGDYSPTSLNGLTADKSESGETFDGSGIGTTEWILPVDMSKAVLEQISQIILLILVLLIVLILAITFVIILLTTSIIISDNVRFISTMRVLGYTDKYVVKTVMGMYMVVIGTMFGLGYGIGWIIFTRVVEILAAKGAVLPLHHPIWLPFVVFIGIIGIYLVAIWAGYKRITKLNSVKILQNSDI